MHQYAAGDEPAFWRHVDAAYLAWQSPYVQWPPSTTEGHFTLNMPAWCRAWLVRSMPEPPVRCESDNAFWRTPGARTRASSAPGLRHWAALSCACPAESAHAARLEGGWVHLSHPFGSRITR
jgi:hypothetical protein